MKKKKEISKMEPKIEGIVLRKRKLIPRAESEEDSDDTVCESAEKKPKKIRSLNAANAETFIPYFADLVHAENFSEHQTFHFSQIGWNFMNMPETASSIDENPTTRFQHKQERFSVVGCTNVPGSFKLRPVIIGKFAKPRSIKNATSSRSFPIYYRNQKNAWLTSELFSEWFHSEFVPKVTQFLKSMEIPPKAILLIDDSLFNRKKIQQDENIKICWLPPDTTALINPMNQGIFQFWKSKYRQKLLQFITNSLENGREIDECIKSIDLKNIVHWIAECWETIPCTIISKAWQPLWPDKVSHQNTQEKGTNLHLNRDTILKLTTLLQATSDFKDITSDDLKKWLYPSTVITLDEVLTDEQIIEIVKDEEKSKKRNCDNINNDDNCCEKNTDVIPLIDVKNALEKITRYCQMQSLPFFEEKLPHLHELDAKINSDQPKKNKNNQVL